MGSGKTSAAINYMNEHSDKKYIYATPYLDEVDRIIKMCPKLEFYQPRENKGSTVRSKYYDVMRMLRYGRNIATTHKAISFYTDETLELIKNNGYTLIVDESITALESTKTCSVDMDMLIGGGFAEPDGDTYKTTGKMYDGDVLKFKLLGRLMRSRDIIGSDDVPSGKKFYYWLFRADVLETFGDVIVMTYLFEAQDIYHCLKVSGLPCRKIGVALDQNGNYSFSDEIKWMPEYAGRLGSMIHILDNEKLNSIGDSMKKKDIFIAIEGFAFYFLFVLILGGIFQGIYEKTGNDYFSCNYLFMFNKEATTKIVGFVGPLFDIRFKIFNFFSWFKEYFFRQFFFYSLFPYFFLKVHIISFILVKINLIVIFFNLLNITYLILCNFR